MPLLDIYLKIRYFSTMNSYFTSSVKEACFAFIKNRKYLEISGTKVCILFWKYMNKTNQVILKAGEKGQRIEYSECVCVALVIQYARRMRRILLQICKLNGCSVFPHIVL